MSRMETQTMDFTRAPGDTSDLAARVRHWEAKGWAVRQIVTILPHRWLIVFERPRQEEIEKA